jgi:hypothetical protein
MTFPSSSPFHRSTLLSTALSAAMLLATGAAQADIKSNPSSIVDHGSYITDTVNQRDWYKFSNSLNTLGDSFEEAMATFAPLGWSVASLDQVQGLQAQFGWTADTPSLSYNDNFGLTYAMGDYLGYTMSYYGDVNGYEDHGLMIQAVTSDSYFFETYAHAVTMSQTENYVGPRGDQYYLGDKVQGVYDLLPAGTANEDYGVWLSRDSVPAVPEPGTWALCGLGLMGVFVRRRMQG